MLRSRIIGGAALLAALVVGLVVTERDAQARTRRCCYRGYRHGYAYNYNYGTTSGGTYSTNYGPTNCNPSAVPTNPDGSIAPQPGDYNSPNASPPPPAPTPPSALN